MARDKGFARRLRALGSKVEKNVNKLVKQVGLVADREVVYATPVDTGRARSNWTVSLGSSANSVREPYSPGKGGSSGPANAQAAIEQGTAVIEMRKFGQDIVISNNLPYIGRLNDGYSAQAPALFVQQAVQRAVSVVGKTRVLRDGN